MTLKQRSIDHGNQKAKRTTDADAEVHATHTGHHLGKLALILLRIRVPVVAFGVGQRVDQAMNLRLA